MAEACSCSKLVLTSPPLPLAGTNDKAGSVSIFYRFVQARSIKETFCPPEDFPYPSNLL